MGVFDRLKSAWNIFQNRTDNVPNYHVRTDSLRPDRFVPSITNARSIVEAIYTRIANDVASVEIEHVRVNDDGRFTEVIDDNLNRCFTISANIDQIGRDFRLDIVSNLLETGTVAVVPTHTDINPDKGSYEILAMRVGKIMAWQPDRVKVQLYNDRTGRKEEMWVLKKRTVIIENPFYQVMNAPNSTLKRLTAKLALLDNIDNRNADPKLDLILQMPFQIASEARQKKAGERINRIKDQLENSDYGIAYIDATEKITQLNRSVESNLMPQIEWLTKQLYAQLGISEEVFSGTASEQVMLNYQNRVLEPILTSITNEFTRKLLTRTAITQHQRIEFYMNRFKLVSLVQLADFADKFSRNSIMSPNEFRSILGLKASDDQKSDMLYNRNMQTDADVMGGSEVTDSNGVPVSDWDISAADVMAAE
jgi:hypothetical protein